MRHGTASLVLLLAKSYLFSLRQLVLVSRCRLTGYHCDCLDGSAWPRCLAPRAITLVTPLGQSPSPLVAARIRLIMYIKIECDKQDIVTSLRGVLLQS